MDQIVKPLVIPVFIPHSGCPHQCAFCNQSIITSQTSKPADLPDKKTIAEIITQYLKYKGLRKYVELAFFGGNFLGLEHETIIQLLDIIQPYIHTKQINGIRFSTRPDTITTKTLELIRPYMISAIELGVQSMNDKVLLQSKRGHTRMDIIKSINLLKKYQYKIGVQVMVGLPGDHENSLFESTKELAQLAPDFARIYPLMVLKGSLMEQWYKQGKYQPLSLEESIWFVKKMVQIFKKVEIDIIRMGLQASDYMEDESMVLAGPWHPAFGHLVFSELFYDRVCNKIDRSSALLKAEKLVLIVHPREESRLRGDKNTNLKRLENRYQSLRFSIDLDETMSVDQLAIRQAGPKFPL